MKSVTHKPEADDGAGQPAKDTKETELYRYIILYRYRYIIYNYIDI